MEGLGVEMIGSLLDRLIDAGIKEIAKETSYKEWKKRNGFTTSENDFIDIYVESIIEFSLYLNSKEFSNFLREKSVIQSVYNLWYLSTYNNFYDHLNNLLNYFSIQDSIFGNHTSKELVDKFEEIFRNNVNISQSTSDRIKQDQLKNIERLIEQGHENISDFKNVFAFNLMLNESSDFHISKIKIDEKLMTRVLNELVLTKRSVIFGDEGRGKSILGKTILHKLKNENNHKVYYLDLQDYLVEKNGGIFNVIEKLTDTEAFTSICIDNIQVNVHELDLILKQIENINSTNKAVCFLLLSRPFLLSKYMSPFYKWQRGTVFNLSPSIDFVKEIIKLNVFISDEQILEKWIKENLYDSGQGGVNLRILQHYLNFAKSSFTTLTNLTLESIIDEFIYHYIRKEVDFNNNPNFTSDLDRMAFISSVNRFDIPLFYKIDDKTTKLVQKGLIKYENGLVSFPHSIDAKLFSLSYSKIFSIDNNMLVIKYCYEYIKSRAELDSSDQFKTRVTKLISILFNQNKKYSKIFIQLIDDCESNHLIYSKSLNVFNYVFRSYQIHHGFGAFLGVYNVFRKTIKNAINNYLAFSVLVHFRMLEKEGLDPHEFIPYYFDTEDDVKFFLEKAELFSSSGDFNRLKSYTEIAFKVEIQKSKISNAIHKSKSIRKILPGLILNISEAGVNQIDFLTRKLHNEYECSNEVSLLELKYFKNVIQRHYLEYKSIGTKLFLSKLENMIELKKYEEKYYSLSLFVKSLKDVSEDKIKHFRPNLIDELKGLKLNERSIHFLMHIYDIADDETMALINDIILSSSNEEIQLIQNYYDSFKLKYLNLTGFLPYAMKFLRKYKS